FLGVSNQFAFGGRNELSARAPFSHFPEESAMAFDAFMYTTGGAVPAEGETTDKDFAAKKAWEISSFSFGASNHSTVGSHKGGSGAGKVSISSFNIMKKTDNASPSLFKSCCMGSFYDTAVVTLRKAGGKGPLVYLK